MQAEHVMDFMFVYQQVKIGMKEKRKKFSVEIPD